jgi:hypothetical protein
MLSRRELGNAIQALVGQRPAALGDLPADKHDLVYDRVVEAQTVSSLHEDAFEAIADQIADGLLAKDLGAVVPACAPKSALPASEYHGGLASKLSSTPSRRGRTAARCSPRSEPPCSICTTRP